MKKILFIFFIFLISNNAYSKIIITNLDENIKFTEFGREVKMKIKVKIELERNYFYKEWSYIFDKKSKIEISEAKVVGKEYKTLFGNNELKFQFNNAVNGDIMEFEFKYFQFNNKEVKYSRQEFVLLPEFTRGAEGKLSVEIPDNLAVYSLNPDFIQNGNVYIWQGKVPQNGFFDFFFLTLKKAKWKIEVLNQIKGDEKINKIDMTIPLYFKNGNNIIEEYNIETNHNDLSVIKEELNNIIVNFNDINSSLIQVKLDATLQNNFDNKIWIKLNPNEYLKIDEKLARNLYETIYKAQTLNQNINEPLYILLAKWVHNHIIYDETYIGKEMNTPQIISTGKGVCIHYAQLYADLLKTAGIPSVIVAGESYNTEKNKFESHAWNLIYVNGEWISIDPTWGLYSGKLPVSHIFFYFNDRNILNYTVYGNSVDSFKSEIKKNIDFLG